MVIFFQGQVIAFPSRISLILLSRRSKPCFTCPTKILKSNTLKATIPSVMKKPPGVPGAPPGAANGPALTAVESVKSSSLKFPVSLTAFPSVTGKMMPYLPLCGPSRVETGLGLGFVTGVAGFVTSYFGSSIVTRILFSCNWCIKKCKDKIG